MRRLIIGTERLQVRNLKLSDLPEFYSYRSNPEVTKYQGFDVFSIEQAKAFITKPTDKEFGKQENGFSIK